MNLADELAARLGFPRERVVIDEAGKPVAAIRANDEVDRKGIRVIAG